MADEPNLLSLFSQVSPDEDETMSPPVRPRNPSIALKTGGVAGRSASVNPDHIVPTGREALPGETYATSNLEPGIGGLFYASTNAEQAAKKKREAALVPPPRPPRSSDPTPTIDPAVDLSMKDKLLELNLRAAKGKVAQKQAGYLQEERDPESSNIATTDSIKATKERLAATHAPPRPSAGLKPRAVLEPKLQEPQSKPLFTVPLDTGDEQESADNSQFTLISSKSRRTNFKVPVEKQEN